MADESSLSRTGRPLTNGYWLSRVARWKVGSPTWPDTASPGRSAETVSALSRKSGSDDLRHPGQPALGVRRARQAVELHRGRARQGELHLRVSHGEAADHVRRQPGPRRGRSSGTSAGPASRRRDRGSRRWCRAAGPRGRTGLLRPASTTMQQAVSAPSRALVTMSRRDTAPMEGRASPRKPKVAMADRSPRSASRWRGARPRGRGRPRSSRMPSSTTRIRLRPPASIGDIDPAGAGIERVLDQLLDGRGRTLDHFAGRDAVDQDRIETSDRNRHADGRVRSGPRLGRNLTISGRGWPRSMPEPMFLG